MDVTKPVVGALVGSLRRDSINGRLARVLKVRIGGRAECKSIRIDGLPHDKADLEAESPPEIVAFRAELRACEALIFVTPEYNRSISGVLKNSIGWASRPRDHERIGWQAGCGHRLLPGRRCAIAAQQHLRNILSVLEVFVMGQPEVKLVLKQDDISNDRTVESPQGICS